MQWARSYHPASATERPIKAFHDPNGDHAGSERRDHEQRQQVMDHFGRDVHEHTYQAKCPDTGRKSLEMSVRSHITFLALAP